jgi:hypothetical protein
MSRITEDKIEVDYRQDAGLYLFKFSRNGDGYLTLTQDEMEHLYNEIGSALMHRHYSQKPKEVESEWEN